MECDKVKELLPFIDDGSIEQDIINDVKHHLSMCAECGKEYIEIKQSLDIIRSAFIRFEPQPSPDLLDVVKRKIDKRKRARKAYKWAFSAAAVVIFGVFISMYSFLTRDLIDTDSYQMVMVEHGEELYNYIAEQYLDAYELYELVEDADIFYEYSLEDAMMQYDYVDITLDDVIQTLDINEMSYLLNEVWGAEK